MTTNPDHLPERLIAFRPKRSPTSLAGGPAFAAEEQRPGDRPTCAEEQAYVREDVAALNTASMLVAAEAEIDTLSTQSAALAIANMDLMDETAALRAEVEALREWKARAIDELRRCEAWLVKRGASYEEHAGKAAGEEIRMLWEQSVAVNRESICKVDAMRGALACKDDNKATLAANEAEADGARMFWAGVCAEEAQRLDDAAKSEMRRYESAVEDDVRYGTTRRNHGITIRFKTSAEVSQRHADWLRKCAGDAAKAVDRG